MLTQLEFIFSGSDVKRYHTVTTLTTETVGHHSHGVAMLCLVLQPEAGVNLLKAALYHDLAEHITGDIPSPAKRLYGIGEQVSELENKLLISAGLTTPELTEAEARTLKLADLAQGALFCLREVERGNRTLLTVTQRYLAYYDKLSPETFNEQVLRGIIFNKYMDLKA
jgi:5'-deoxynucleotidase YfbR-like HD superfamily hydrolase